MDATTYIYVDGENHYQRTLDVLRQRWDDKTLEFHSVERNPSHSAGNPRFPWDRKDDIVHIPECMFFWLAYYPIYWAFHFATASDLFVIRRGVFFSSCTGDTIKLRECRAGVRAAGFEPHIIHESRDRRKSRDQLAREHWLMEKPKGVDIEMATRIAADAFQNNYQNCVIFTNDADFLPVIRLVRQLGKNVAVCGYLSALPDDSELRYVPDQFIDLEKSFNFFRRRGAKPKP